MKLELVVLVVTFINWGGVLLLLILPMSTRRKAEKVLMALSVLGLLLIMSILAWDVSHRNLVFLSAITLLSAVAGYTLLRRWSFLR